MCDIGINIGDVCWKVGDTAETYCVCVCVTAQQFFVMVRALWRCMQKLGAGLKMYMGGESYENLELKQAGTVLCAAGTVLCRQLQ
jgi:hypothetical protein